MEPVHALAAVGYKLRTWPDAVEFVDERDGGHAGQVGGFSTQAEAGTCLTRLEADDWKDLRTNTVPIDERLTHWEWVR